MAGALLCDGTTRRILAAVVAVDPGATDGVIAHWCGHVDRSNVSHWREKGLPAWALRRILATLDRAGLNAAPVLAELAAAGGCQAIPVCCAPSKDLRASAFEALDAAAGGAREVSSALVDGHADAAEWKRILAKCDEMEAAIRAIRAAAPKGV